MEQARNGPLLLQEQDLAVGQVGLQLRLIGQAAGEGREVGLQKGQHIPPALRPRAGHRERWRSRLSRRTGEAKPLKQGGEPLLYEVVHSLPQTLVPGTVGHFGYRRVREGGIQRRGEVLQEEMQPVMVSTVPQQEKAGRGFLGGEGSSRQGGAIFRL